MKGKYLFKNNKLRIILPISIIILNYRSFETAIPLEDSVVREVSLVLRDWNCIWKSLYVVCSKTNLIILL